MAKNRYDRASYNERAGRMYVVDGSAARQLDYDYYYEEEQQIRREEHRRAPKPRKKARHMNLPYVMMLLAATTVLVVLCIQYIQLQSSIRTHQSTIAYLQTSLNNLQDANRVAEQNVSLSVDLNHVYEVATVELGMVYPDDEQVIVYDKSESEYVRQYDAIPTHD